MLIIIIIIINQHCFFVFYVDVHLGGLPEIEGMVTKYWSDPLDTKPRYPCTNCDSVFSRKNNLYYHVKYECGQLPRFSCPYCTYRAKHVSNTRAHVRRKHPGYKVYTIDICNMIDGTQQTGYYGIE